MKFHKVERLTEDEIQAELQKAGLSKRKIEKANTQAQKGPGYDETADSDSGNASSRWIWD